MKNKPVFIFDTNSFVSIALFPTSSIRLAIKKAESIGEIVLSEETFAELTDVLLRSKFDKYLSVEDRLEFIKRIEIRYAIVPTTIEIKACRDAKDDKLLSLAVSVQASCIVSGDKDLLELHPFKGIQIVSATDFLSLY